MAGRDYFIPRTTTSISAPSPADDIDVRRLQSAAASDEIYPLRLLTKFLFTDVKYIFNDGKHIFTDVKHISTVGE